MFAPRACSPTATVLTLVRPVQMIDLFDRVIRTWNTLLTRDLFTRAPADATVIFRAEEALPTQWPSALRTNLIRQDLPCTSD